MLYGVKYNICNTWNNNVSDFAWRVVEHSLLARSLRHFVHCPILRLCYRCHLKLTNRHKIKWYLLLSKERLAWLSQMVEIQDRRNHVPPLLIARILTSPKYPYPNPKTKIFLKIGGVIQISQTCFSTICWVPLMYWATVFSRLAPLLNNSSRHQHRKKSDSLPQLTLAQVIACSTVESGFFFCSKLCLKNYPLLLVESTSNFAWSLFWRKFSSRVIYFCQFFSASKIFVKLLFIWAGLDVFPFKMMKKEACHRVQHVKISRNWSSSFVGRFCACLKNQTFERQWKMCSTGLNACNLGYGGQRTRISHRCHGKHGEHRKNCTSGTVIE